MAAAAAAAMQSIICKHKFKLKFITSNLGRETLKPPSERRSVVLARTSRNVHAARHHRHRTHTSMGRTRLNLTAQ